MKPETLYFVHISDSHFGPHPGAGRHGHQPLPCAQRLVDTINSLPVTPDFVVHTGDIVDRPDPAAFALAAETLGALRVPIYYVNGNHDAPADIKAYLPMGPKEDLTADPGVLCYAFERKGYRFLVLDGHGPPEIDPHGQLPAGQLDLLRHEAQDEGPPLVVFIHFSVWPLNSPWMDTHMHLLNAAAFHEALLPARHRLRGVFHGHVHQSVQTIRDRILYCAVGSSFSQFTAWPGEEMIGLDPAAPPYFNFVHLLPEQTIVHQHTFPRP